MMLFTSHTIFKLFFLQIRPKIISTNQGEDESLQLQLSSIAEQSLFYLNKIFNF